MTVTAELSKDQVLAGTYRIEKLLGRGGMGAVYQAEHLRTRKQVALKTLRPGFGKIREIAQRFEREARATSLLSHPGVVKVDDFGELEDGALFLVMELVRGASLREIIDDGIVAPARAFTIARLLLDALGHAHGHGVIHRDLKPDNIKVTSDPDHDAELVKILDFGIAKVVGAAEEALGATEKLTEAGIAFGTPDYMAPEQALGQPVDARADLYSVGVMLFEMLAGRRPFVSDEPIAVARMQVAVPPPTLAAAAPDRRFSHASEALVARALGKRPSERFADAVEMIAALDIAALAEVEEAEAAAEGSGLRARLARAVTPTPLPRAPTPLPSSRGQTPLPLSPAQRARASAGEDAARLAPEALAGPAVAAPSLRARLTGPLTRASARLSAQLARLSRRQKLIAGAAGTVGLLIVLVIALPGGAARVASSGPATPGSPFVPSSMLPLAETPLARAGRALIAAGKPAEAIATLERGLRAAGGDRDASAQLALGDAHVAADQPGEALAAYELAVAIAPAAARDERAQRHVLELAARGKTWKLRQRATTVAERMDVAGRIDRFEAAVQDLAQAPSCAERRTALLTLRGLKDARALAAIKRARSRRSGFFGSGRPNACLEKEAAEVIAELEPALE